MWTIGNKFRFGGLAVACGLALLGAPGDAMAGVVNPAPSFELPVVRSEPFGPATMTVVAGQLADKWSGVERELEEEALVLALCEENRERCASPAARKFLDIVDGARARDGRARLGEINRAVNLAIRPASDLALYGAEDVWRSPLALLAEGAGDCEDYAIAKFVALRAAGMAAEDLRIVILRDQARHQDHAVAAVRLDGNWLLLDNRHMALVEDMQARQVRPLFVVDRSGVRQYPEAPSLAVTLPPVDDTADREKLALRVR